MDGGRGHVAMGFLCQPKVAMEVPKPNGQPSTGKADPEHTWMAAKFIHYEGIKSNKSKQRIRKCDRQ